MLFVREQVVCVCVVLLEGVRCMQVGRLHYWCNWLVGEKGIESFSLNQF